MPTFERKQGGSFTFNDDGTIKVDGLPPLKSVMVDLREIASHEVLRHGDVSAHNIRFIHGGFVALQVRDNGDLGSLNQENVQISLDSENNLVISKRD